MSSPRQRKIANAIRTELSELLLLEVNDPRLSGITVTEVQIDREMQYADIYVNALGEESRQEEVLQGLERAAGFLRHRLSKSLDLRKLPELRFEWDTAFEHAARIDKLLSSLDSADDAGGSDDAD